MLAPKISRQINQIFVLCLKLFGELVFLIFLEQVSELLDLVECRSDQTYQNVELEILSRKLPGDSYAIDQRLDFKFIRTEQKAKRLLSHISCLYTRAAEAQVKKKKKKKNATISHQVRAKIQQWHKADKSTKIWPAITLMGQIWLSIYCLHYLQAKSCFH